VKLRNNFELKKVKSAGRALKTAGSKLPEKRRIELEEVLKTYYSVQEVNRIPYTVQCTCSVQNISNISGFF